MREWSEEKKDFVIHDYDVEMEIFDSLPKAVREAVNHSWHGWSLTQLQSQIQNSPQFLVVAAFSALRPEIVASKWSPHHPQVTQPGKKI